MATARIAYSASQPYTVPWHGPVRNLKVYGGAFAITAADVTTINNTVALFTVPKGFTVVSLHVDTTDMDTSTGLTFDLGDATTAARLMAAQSGQSAAMVNVTLPVTQLGFRYTADTDIVLLMHAAASGTPTAGAFTCFLVGFVDA